MTSAFYLPQPMYGPLAIWSLPLREKKDAYSSSCSDFGTTTNLYIEVPDSEVNRNILKRLRMLRLVIERQPVRYTVCPGYYTVHYYKEILECGHEMYTHFSLGVENGKPVRRRNCKACCAELQSSPKKPIAVPESPSPRKTGAA